MRVISLAICAICTIFANEHSEEIFTKIYETGGWGFNEEGEGFSGVGSTVANTLDYIHFLENFIQANQIQTVIDAGCGDWTFSKEIEWGNVHYVGVDIVKSVIEKNRGKYGRENISFEHLNILDDQLPSAELLICKDVLMHLPIEAVKRFLATTVKYKHCLFIHNVDLENPENVNQEIVEGGFRPLDITKPPFDVLGTKIFMYRTDHAVKLVIYCNNQGI